MCACWGGIAVRLQVPAPEKPVKIERPVTSQLVIRQKSECGLETERTGNVVCVKHSSFLADPLQGKTAGKGVNTAELGLLVTGDETCP